MRRSALWVVSLVVASGCTVGTLDDESTSQAELASAAIGVEDSGSWYEYVCSNTCWRKTSFWIDLDVRNDAYAKQVGVVWTSDNWKTHQVSYATYEGSLGGGRERWGVDVTLGYFSGAMDRTEVEYADFVVMNGATSWDPTNNHDIFGRVTAEHPVKLLSSAVDYEAGVGGVLTGTVRVFNLAYAKQVTVVYTTDDWATAAETEATWAHGDDWTFRVAGLGPDPLPDTVQFAIRYRVAGEESWDNNDGYNYVHRLQPQIYLGTTWSTPEEPLSGIFSAYGSQYGDIPLQRLDVRVDDQPWQIGDVGLFWRQVELSTQTLADGPHTLALRAVLDGGYQTSATQTFTVQNRVTPLGAWTPSYGPLGSSQADAHGSAGGLAVDAAGHVYEQWNQPWSYDSNPFRGVARFASFGTDVAPLAFAHLPTAPGNSYYPSVDRLAVDDAGRAYGIERWPFAVWRWTADGAIDTSFGDAGAIDFSQAFGGYYLDGIGDVATGGGYLWVVGSCPSFETSCSRLVARFDDTGALAGVVLLPPADPPYYDYSQPVATYAGGALWVQSKGQLLRIGDDAQGALGVLDTVTLDAKVHAPLQDLVRTPSGRFFGLDSGNRLVAIGDDGTLQGAWLLYSYQHLTGGVSSPMQLAVLASGDVAVLDGDQGRVVVFDDALVTPPPTATLR